MLYARWQVHYMKLVNEEIYEWYARGRSRFWSKIGDDVIIRSLR